MQVMKDLNKKKKSGCVYSVEYIGLNESILLTKRIIYTEYKREEEGSSNDN